MVYLGIDPGLDGGIAVLATQTETAVVMPTIKSNVKHGKSIVDIVAAFEWIWAQIRANTGVDWKTHAASQTAIDVVVGLERVGCMPKQGITSAFNFGVTFGLLQGMVKICRLPLVLITPQRWKKVVLIGTKRDKQAAINYSLQKYPRINLKRTERCTAYHDGMADAVCIAEYLKLIYNREGAQT